MLHERFDRAYSLLVYNEIQEYGSQTSLSAVSVVTNKVTALFFYEVAST